MRARRDGPGNRAGNKRALGVFESITAAKGGRAARFGFCQCRLGVIVGSRFGTMRYGAGRAVVSLYEKLAGAEFYFLMGNYWRWRRSKRQKEGMFYQ